VEMGENPQASSASFTLHGAGVSGGIAIGHAHLVSTARLEVAHYEIAAQEVDAEIARFDAAIAQVRASLPRLRRAVHRRPAEMKAILSLHAMLLNDSNLSAVPRELIGSRRCNAEWRGAADGLPRSAVRRDGRPYLRERKPGHRAGVERECSRRCSAPARAAEPSSEKELIVVAHDLSPADMILFKQHQYAGFVTDLGGVTSHTAIRRAQPQHPRDRGPASRAQHDLEGELVIVDGREGVLIVNRARACSRNTAVAERNRRRAQKLKRLRTARSATMDGSRSTFRPISSCRRT